MIIVERGTNNSIPPDWQNWIQVIFQQDLLLSLNVTDKTETELDKKPPQEHRSAIFTMMVYSEEGNKQTNKKQGP